MSPSIIGYILLGIIALFLLVQVLLGIKRGVKKSLFRLSWFLGVCAILYFVVPPLSQWLNTFDISALKLNIFGPVTKLSDIGTNILAKMGIDFSNTSISAFAENLPMIVLNILLFVALFWSINTLLYPIWAIIASRIFDKKKREEKRYNKKLKELRKQGVPVSEETAPVLVKESKNRPVGALVGVVISMLLLAVTLMPVVGVNAIYQKVYSGVTIEKDGQQVPYLSTVVDEEILNYAGSYENSVAKSIMTYSGTSALSSFLFDAMAYVQVGGERITISNEVNAGINLYNDFLAVKSYYDDLENLNATQFDELLSKLGSSLDDASKSKAISLLSDDAINVAVNQYLLEKVHESSFEVVVGSVDCTESVVELVEKLATKKMTFAEVRANIQRTLNAASLLNSVRNAENVSVLTGIISRELDESSEIIDFVAENLNTPTQFSQSFVNNICDIDILSDTFSTIINSAVKMAYESLDIGTFSERSDLNLSTSKATLSSVLSDVINFAKLYSKYGGINFSMTDGEGHVIDETIDAATYVGRTIDNIKDKFISETSYNSLVNYLIDTVNDAGADFIELDNISNKLRSVVSWKTELTALSKFYSAVQNLGDFSMDDVLSDNGKLSSLGEPIADIVSAGNSKLITNENMREVFSALFNALETEDPSLMEYFNVSVNGKTVKNIILDNIWYLDGEQGYKTKIINAETGKSNWDNELNYTMAFVRNIQNTLANFDPESVSAQDMRTLGESMDNALSYTKLFLSNEVLRAYMQKFLDGGIVSSPEINSIMDKWYDEDNEITIKTALLNNIYSAGESNVSSWADEMEILYSIFASSLSDDPDLTDLGALLDNLSNSEVFSREIVKVVLVDYIDDALDSIALSGELADVINNAKDIVIDNVKNEEQVDGKWTIVYEYEFERLQNLMDVFQYDYTNDPDHKFESGGEYVDYNGSNTERGRKFYAIGFEFNKLAGFSSEYDVVSGESVPIPESKLVNKSVITAMLQSVMESTIGDKLPENATTMLKSNVAEIENYAFELGYIDTLILDVDYVSNNTFGGNCSDFGSLGEDLDIIVSVPSKLITRPIIKEIIMNFYNNQSSITSASSDENLSVVMGNVRTKLESSLGQNVSYAVVLNELLTMASKVDDLQDVLSLSAGDLKTSSWDSTTGGALDSFASMTYVCDKFITKDIANVLVNGIKNTVNAAYSGAGDSIVSAINTSSVYDFDGYLTLKYEGSHADDSYYTDLMGEIKSQIPNA